MTTEFRARDRLRAAIYDRHMHSSDCPRWDYEANHCEECDRHDEVVARARASLLRATGMVLCRDCGAKVRRDDACQIQDYVGRFCFRCWDRRMEPATPLRDGPENTAQVRYSGWIRDPLN